MNPRVPRVRRIAAVAIVLAAGLAACGNDDKDSASSSPVSSSATTASSTGSSGSTPTDSSAAPAADAFPVTIEHALGSTEVKAEPKRIVSVGVTEQDSLLAVGVKPVGVTEWYGEYPYATWPWAQDELGDAKPDVLTRIDTFEFEKIAALKPDLIIGTSAGIDEASYKTLSAIAPTIAHPKDGPAYFAKWDDQARLIAKAVGKSAEMDEIIAAIEADFAAAAKAHPEFAGKKAIFLQNAFYDNQAIAYQDGLSTKLITDLGFIIPKELDAFASDTATAQAFIPMEQLGVLDEADVLVWATEGGEDRAALESEAMYKTLEEVREGRLVFTDALTAGAIYFTSPLSLPYVLEKIVPALSSTLAGDGPVQIDEAK